MRIVFAFFVNTLFNFAIGLLVAKFLGPDQFGRFALALAVGVVIQTAAFDWIRLTAVRFYSEHRRSAHPELRATLDLTFAIFACGLVALAFVAAFAGMTFALPQSLVGLAVAAAITNGLFDYNTALVRARFNDMLYLRLIITKNILALLLTVGGAFVFGSAQMALAGTCFSMAGSLIVAREALRDPAATPRLARRSLAFEYMRYSVPIVAANFLYLMMPFVNRALVTAWYGFAETGQFSLALDIGTRVMAAIGTALDVLLFQIAVRADELHGPEQAKQQVAQNMAVVFAIMLPATAGLWLILPSLDQLVVPQDFRGPFAHYLTLLLPGLFCSSLMSFAINPVFLIPKRTAPLIAGALVACALDPIFIALLPRGGDATSLAIAQTGAMVGALVALICFAAFTQPRWPRGRDLAIAIMGTAAMSAALMPLRQWPAGVVTLAVEIVAGATVYAAFIAAFDMAGLRSLAIATLRSWRARTGKSR
jgi:O-antigen/teichoic acid export membrane protein